MKLSYYPGCTLKTNAQNFDISTVETAKTLGIELVELPRWNCCGTVHALAKDDVMHYLAPIRNLVRVEQMKEEGLVDDKRLATQCAMCWNTLKRANTAANNDSEKMRKIRDNMEKEPEYSGMVEVRHMLEVLRDMGWDKVRESVKSPLKGLKVAPYYGCLLLRPRDMALDDPDGPRVMEDLLEALGAEVVDFAYKTRCCGAYHTVHLKEVAAELSYTILNQAVEEGADIVVTACPLCEFNLGKRQGEMLKAHSDFASIPVIYYTQLMALAFGLGKEAMAFEENDPDPRPVLVDRRLI
ncbi:MAG: CoB--CoM heterodisulfide reductase iron-sulfur subunit B family protein [Candidatus Bathyarchaeota archaeon]|jgi:heterodisulfide reductase subunit B